MDDTGSFSSLAAFLPFGCKKFNSRLFTLAKPLYFRGDKLFTDFFQRKDMERVVATMMHVYRGIFHDPSYATGRAPEALFAKVAVLGAWLYAKEAKVNEIYFVELLLEKLKHYIEDTQEINLETVCFAAASLRGDLSKHSKNIGLFFGNSARKLDLDMDIFKKYPIKNPHGFLIAAKMETMRLAAEN